MASTNRTRRTPQTTQAGLWTDMRKSDFDTSEPLTLFGPEAVDNSLQLRKPDACGTPDLFSQDV